MPQITSCPECSKKLRVPDELIGKKVKCPGCTTMFIAEADEQDEPAPPPRKAPPKPPAERSRPDAVTSSPRPKRRDDDEDEEEAPPPRGKRRDDDDEEDERPARRREEVREDRPSRSRRDEEEEDERPRRGRHDDEEDEEDERPRRGRRRDRDDDDDDDDRPRGRRRGSEDSPAQQRRGWEKVRTGLNFAALAGWTQISTVGIGMLGAGILILTIGGSVVSVLGGNVGGGLFSMGIGLIAFVLLLGLINLAEVVLRLVGMGMCMAVPRSRRSSMKGLAITAFCCVAAAVLLNFTGSFLGGVSSGFNGAALIGLSAGGNALGLLSSLAAFVGYVFWIIVLRSICLELGDRDLARKILTILITQIVYGFVAVIVFIIMMVIVGVSAGSAMQGGAAGALGVGLIVAGIFIFLLFAGWLAIYVWYVLTLQEIRDLVAEDIDNS